MRNGMLLCRSRRYAWNAIVCRVCENHYNSYAMRAIYTHLSKSHFVSYQRKVGLNAKYDWEMLDATIIMFCHSTRRNDVLFGDG